MGQDNDGMMKNINQIGDDNTLTSARISTLFAEATKMSHL